MNSSEAEFKMAFPTWVLSASAVRPLSRTWSIIPAMEVTLSNNMPYVIGFSMFNHSKIARSFSVIQIVLWCTTLAGSCFSAICHISLMRFCLPQHWQNHPTLLYIKLCVRYTMDMSALVRF